jgi:hypothetical protein
MGKKKKGKHPKVRRRKFHRVPTKRKPVSVSADPIDPAPNTERRKLLVQAIPMAIIAIVLWIMTYFHLKNGN